MMEKGNEVLTVAENRNSSVDYGVELLRDGKEDTYWQSDGPQPHHINVQFQKKVSSFITAQTISNSGMIHARTHI